MFLVEIVVFTRFNDQLMGLGIKGRQVHESLQALLESANDPFYVLKMADAEPRSLVLCPAEQAQSLWQQLASTAKPVASRFWLEHDIVAGIPWPGEAGSEEFLPQSLNLDLLAGLSFNKGCYPGQEIISRMHFRGKLKQRMQLVSVDTDDLPLSGTHIYARDSEKQCGTVVRACPADSNSCLALATLDLDQLDTAELFIGGQDGPALKILELPYNLDAS